MGMFTIALKNKNVVIIRKFCESLQKLLTVVSRKRHKSPIMHKCTLLVK